MSVQIKTIALYNYTGEIRRIDFHIGAVNIITGKSRTGKSGVIDIVDYCLGRSTFNVFEGVNRDVVSWYAVILQVDDAEILLAKPAPGGAARTQTRVYLETASRIELPPLRELKANSNDAAVVSYLSRLMGMSANKTEPAAGRTTPSFQASIHHAKFYLFQDQGVIASSRPEIRNLP